MSPSLATIDVTADTDIAFPTSNSSNPAMRVLLLAPPSIATQEEKLRDVFAIFNRPTTDLQMLDRLSAGLVSLPSNTYDSVFVLTNADGTRQSELLNRNVYTALVPSMKVGAKLQIQGEYFGKSEAREAVLAGLVEKDGGFEKLEGHEGVAIPLLLGAKRGIRTGTNINDYGLDDFRDDDDLIDENTLLSEEDLKKPRLQPPECQPKPGRRRRACKDCTCGLAARLKAEDETRQANTNKGLSLLRLRVDDLNELDFTVQGKIGSCGNCALGDAFRCAGCPFVGVPAFKPGQEVQILNDIAQL